MKIHSSFEFDFGNAEDASIFIASFMPEFDTLPMKRSKWEIIQTESSSPRISVNLTAEDTTAFRASINSLIQFVHIVEQTIQIVSNPNFTKNQNSESDLLD